MLPGLASISLCVSSRRSASVKFSAVEVWLASPARCCSSSAVVILTVPFSSSNCLAISVELVGTYSGDDDPAASFSGAAGSGSARDEESSVLARGAGSAVGAVSGAVVAWAGFLSERVAPVWARTCSVLGWVVWLTAVTVLRRALPLPLLRPLPRPLPRPLARPLVLRRLWVCLCSCGVECV